VPADGAPTELSLPIPWPGGAEIVVKDLPQAVFHSDRQLKTGLVGRSIQLSRSPQMHHDEAGAQGLDLEYRLFDFAELDLGEADLRPFLEALERAGYLGVNVTHPYKQAVIPLLDELSDGARQVGAVNTVAFRDGRMHGFNTDVTGFAESFRQGVAGEPIDQVFQAGAGGAGSATANAMLTLGAGRIAIFDPDADKVANLCEQLSRFFGSDRVEAVEDVAAAMKAAHGVINTTPIGMKEHPGTSIPVELLTPEQWVADVVYFPIETELLRQAKARGCRVLDGGGMAVYQAAGAFEIFTGRAPDRDRMRARFLAALG
jgi:shikimate dehydrogenase